MTNKHKLWRLTESLYSKPHLISQAGFDAISAYLDTRNRFGAAPPENLANDPDNDADDADDAEQYGGIGVINVVGALTYKPVMGACGAVGCNYESILSQANTLIESGINTLVLYCDSGGGEGFGAFETGDELRNLCDAAGVYSIAYNDGCMASACYALAVQCDEVISNPSAETGSIGVLVALYNNSKSLEQDGITRSFISAGDSKIPYADDGSWKPGFLADLQMKVDAAYEQFVSYVAGHTGLSTDAVKATQAKTFLANDALDMGLISSVMTRSEFASYLQSRQQQGPQSA